MNLQHLRYFLELAKWKNYRLAAKKLFISQPALSKAIKGLEEELAIPLFVREGNHNHLTRYGKILHYYVESSLEILDKGVDELKAMSDQREKYIRIGAIDTCATQIVPSSIEAFNERFPGVSFRCGQSVSSEIVEDVKNLNIDIGFISDWQIPNQYRYVEKVEITKFEGLLAVPNNSELANKQAVMIDDIRNEPFISYTSECGNLHTIRTAFEINHIEPLENIYLRYNAESAILAAVENGLGIAIVSDTIFNRQANVTFIELEDVKIAFPAFLVWKSDVTATTVVGAFKDYLLQFHHLGSLSATSHIR